MELQPVRNAFALTDICQEPVWLGLVKPQQDIDARACQFWKAGADLLHLQLTESDGLNRRHRNLRDPNARWISVEQKNID